MIPYHQVFQLGIHRAQGKAELAADAQALPTWIQNETGFPMEQLILEEIRLILFCRLRPNDPVG
ncbi:MAG: hypothetical protein ACRER2_15715 [Methylococcales bacterium]